MPRRLDEQVQVLGRSVSEAAKVEALQYVERLQGGDRAGRDGGAEQLIVSVGGPNGVEHLRLVVGKVLCAQDAAVSPHLLVDGCCDLAPVEGVLALSADPFEGVGQVALDDSCAGRRGVSVRQEHARGLAIPDQVGHISCDRQAGGGVCLEPLPGVVDGRLQQPLQREGAEQLVGAAHAGRNSRHACGAVSDGVGAVFDLVYPVAPHRLADYTEHVGGRGPGRPVTVVDGDAATLRCHVDDHLTVAGDGGVPRLDDVEAEAGCDGGVHGVSAALEDVDADLGGDRVRSGDGTVLDDDLVLVRPPYAACVQRPRSPSVAHDLPG